MHRIPLVIAIFMLLLPLSAHGADRCCLYTQNGEGKGCLSHDTASFSCPKVSGYDLQLLQTKKEYGGTVEGCLAEFVQCPIAPDAQWDAATQKAIEDIEAAIKEEQAKIKCCVYTASGSNQAIQCTSPNFEKYPGTGCAAAGTGSTLALTDQFCSSIFSCPPANISPFLSKPVQQGGEFGVPAEVAANPRCWSKNACVKANGVWDPTDTKCAPWGACYTNYAPITLQVKIGETGTVTNIAEYIQIIYKWLIGIAVILAAALLVIAGVLWTTAGGSPERVTRAKEMISGAVVGLFLAAGSFLILNTLNPNLVALQPPKVYKIRTAALGANFCETQQQPIALAVSATGATSGYPADESGFTLDQKTDAQCGNQYYMKQSGPTEVCLGRVCPVANVPRVCVSKDEIGTKWACEEGKSMAGTINYEANAYVDYAWIMAVCSKEGTLVDTGITFNFEEKGKHYSIPADKIDVFKGAYTKCPKVAASSEEEAQKLSFAGFALKVEINDDAGEFLNALPTGDDEYFGGKTMCANMQSDGLSKPLGNENNEKITDPQKFFQLFTVDELGKGVLCDLVISRKNFPDF